MKIIQDKTHKVWITSDTHFSHKNICRGVTDWDSSERRDRTRDFKDIPEMNDAIVHRINNRVMPDDTLIHLGDWSFGGIEQIWEFRRRLMCKNIYLVLGNHDHHIRYNKELPNTFNTQIGRNLFSHEVFTWVGDYLEVTVVNNMDKFSYKETVVCTHYPMASWDKLGKGRIHLHGHIHTPKQSILGPGKMMDVGIDGNDYKPWAFSEVRNIMKNQPIRSLLQHGFDHHQSPDTHLMKEEYKRMRRTKQYDLNWFYAYYVHKFEEYQEERKYIYRLQPHEFHHLFEQLLRVAAREIFDNLDRIFGVQTLLDKNGNEI